jgi:hypothetical protein
MRILFVEDDRQLRTAVARGLKEASGRHRRPPRSMPSRGVVIGTAHDRS